MGKPVKKVKIRFSDAAIDHAVFYDENHPGRGLIEVLSVDFQAGTFYCREIGSRRSKIYDCDFAEKRIRTYKIAWELVNERMDLG